MRRFIPILPPLLLMLLSVAGMVALDRYLLWRAEPIDADIEAILRGVAETLVWLAAAFLVSRLIDIFIWRSVEHRTHRPAPKLLISVVRLLLLTFTIGIIITVVFRQPLTGLVVSSGVIGIVLGFALQRMISDFFCGIALSMEAPFHVGDWIEVDGTVGQVIETNWRATRIVTLEQVTVILPNSFIAERRFSNYNLPQAYFRCEVSVPMEYDVPADDAKRVLLAAARATDGVLAVPEPDVLLWEFAERGGRYVVRFYVSDYSQMQRTRNRVLSSISRHLWQAGLNVPYPKRDVFFAQMPHRELSRKSERDALLARVELFESLEPQELRAPAGAVVETEGTAGDEVVQQGEIGASLFVVVDGLLEARVKAGGQARPVGRIGAGEFFGEMSLLTGSPRGATVVAVTDATLYELSRAVIEPVIQRRPDIAEAISQAITLRRSRREQAAAQADVKASPQEDRGFAEDLLRKIRGFFGIH